MNLYNILMSDDVILEINNNLEYILKNISKCDIILSMDRVK